MLQTRPCQDLQIHKAEVTEKPEQEEDGSLWLGVVVVDVPARYMQSRDLELGSARLAASISYRMPLEIYRYPAANSPTLEPADETVTISEELYRKIRTLCQSHPMLAPLFPKRKVLDQKGVA